MAQGEKPWEAVMWLSILVACRPTLDDVEIMKKVDHEEPANPV
jgi:hypothetical protein